MISVLQGTCLAGIPFLSVVVVMLCFWTVGPTLDGPKIDVDVWIPVLVDLLSAQTLFQWAQDATRLLSPSSALTCRVGGDAPTASGHVGRCCLWVSVVGRVGEARGDQSWPVPMISPSCASWEVIPHWNIQKPTTHTSHRPPHTQIPPLLFFLFLFLHYHCLLFKFIIAEWRVEIKQWPPLALFHPNKIFIYGNIHFAK